jgi:hypothetical protein
LPIAQLNDDYCDCTDGSDEPGTSACANTGGRFYCANKGFKPTYVRAGLVGDGICDCCDGTDEYARPGACTDTCIQAGEAARAVAAATLSSVLGGLQKAQQWEAEAATNTGKWDSEIAALKVSLIEKKAAADAIQVEKAAAELRESEARKEFLEKKAAEEAAKQAEEEAKAATAASAGAEMPSGASVEDSAPAAAAAAAAAEAAAEGVPPAGVERDQPAAPASAEGVEAAGAASAAAAAAAAGGAAAEGAVASDHDLSYPSVDHHPDEVGPEGEYPADDYIPPEGDAPYGDDPHLEDAEYRARYRDDYGEGGERFGGEDEPNLDEDEHRPWSEGDDEPNLDDEPGDDEEGRGRRATWHEEDEHEAAQATETDEAAPKDPGMCLPRGLRCARRRCTWPARPWPPHTHSRLLPSQHTYTRRRLPWPRRVGERGRHGAVLRRGPELTDLATARSFSGRSFCGRSFWGGRRGGMGAVASWQSSGGQLAASWRGGAGARWGRAAGSPRRSHA